MPQNAPLMHQSRLSEGKIALFPRVHLAIGLAGVAVIQATSETNARINPTQNFNVMVDVTRLLHYLVQKELPMLFNEPMVWARNLAHRKKIWPCLELQMIMGTSMQLMVLRMRRSRVVLFLSLRFAYLQ